MWFSARVKVLCSIEGEGPVDFWRSVFVFKAKDSEAALQRAIELGRAQETSHLNVYGERVDFRLLEVETLDCLGRRLRDGREVYFETSPVGDEPTDLDPEKSQLRETVW